MFNRGRSKDHGSRKTTPPQASYMDNNQFANYLTELREKRVTRPGGAKAPGSSSARTSIDPTSSAARTPAATSTTAVNTTATPPFPRADSALSNRTTTTTLSHAPTRPSMSTSRSRRSMQPPASPELNRKSTQIDSTVVQPSATYIERGQRWMEREEAGSLRDALDDMDAAEREKALAVELAAQKLRDEQLEEEERIQMAAQQEASELVHAHLYPEEIKRRQEEEERRKMTGYRYHLRKGSYQHARAASVGRAYKGEDAVIVDLNPRPGMGGRTFSDESTMRSASRTSMRRESSDHSSRPEMPNRQSTDEIRGRTPSKQHGKSYGTLSSTISGVASKSRSWSARRKSGSGKRNISGEVNTVFRPDQIWEEPETSRESSKNRKKEQDAAKAREDMYNDTVDPLSPLKRNPANRVQFANEKSSDSSTKNLSSGLPVQKIDRFEIFRNPPSQSRNPLYTDNRSRSPSPAKLPEVPMKDGKEIRNEEIRKATTKSLKDRSEKLPTPTAVSDRLGRPIVSFDKEWAPAEEKAQKLAEQKKLADLCPPVSAARTKLSQLETEGIGEAKEHAAGGLSAIEAAKRKIFGSAAQEQVSGSIRERRASRSPQRRGRPRTSEEGDSEGGGAESQGGEKGKEEERQGYLETVGGQADTQHELGKVGDAKVGTSEAGVGAEVKVAGKWIVETKKGVSTFRIEDEKTLKEQQARKDGFPYRLDKSSANSSTDSIPLAADLRPTSKHGSHHSTPRTSISQEKLEADIDTTPVATPLASLHKALPVPPPEPAKEPTKPIRSIVSIAPPNPMDRTPTLMARSPFARPRGESFISRRSIFQPEKSVPASPARADSGSSLKSIDNDKPQPLVPFGPSLLSAPRPRPSFLTRTRSRSSVSGHSVFALKKPELAPAPAEPAKATTPPITENVQSPPKHDSQEKTSTESLRPSITRKISSESSLSKALPSLAPTPSNDAPEPFPTVNAHPKPPIKMTPFGPSFFSAPRPRPSLLTRTRSRSLMSGHSVFTLKKTDSTPASPLNDVSKPGLETAGPAPPAHTSHGKSSTEEERPSLSRSRSSDGSISKARPSLPATSSHQPQEALPKAEAPAVKPAMKMTPFGPSLLSAPRPRPSFLTRTRSRSSVAGHSVFALKKPEPVNAPSPPPTTPAVEEEAKPEGKGTAPPSPAHVSQEHTSIEEIKPLFIRAKSSEASISRPLPTPPPMRVEDLPQSAAPTVSPPPPSTPAQVAEAPKPASHITNSHLSAARSRPSFLTRTRSRSSVAGHSPYSLKGEESSSPVESSSPAPPPHDEDRPPFARSKSSENDIPKETPRQSLDGPPERRFAPRSPFARPSLGPTSLSTPPEFSLNKQGSVASRSPFGRLGGARSSMSTVSVPSKLTEFGPSPSVRKSPFDRPKTRDGTTHTRSSLGLEARHSIDENERPESRQSFSNTSAKTKLPWMRNKSVPSIDAGELLGPRSATLESFRLDSPSERPLSREKELPWMKHSNTEPTPTPQKMLVDDSVTESPPAIEITVNTAEVAALYQDVIESPSKAAPEVVVNTTDIAKQYDLVLNESKQLNEKATISALVAPLAVGKKSSLSGARPLPMRPSGPRQSAPSVRRAPREQSRPPPAVAKAETVPERAMSPPPAVVEPPIKRPGHKKSTSISTPSIHDSVLAPPKETLSEVRPPAPEENEVKPMPTIYGPPRANTPPGFPPSLNIQAPSIAIRAPSPAPASQGPQISVSAPAPNVSGPAINEPSTAAPLRQQSTRPLPHPTRPLPQPGSSARPLPRPGSSSGHRPSSSSGHRPSSSSSHRPLPTPANARPIPNPSSRVAPPPNLARPSSDSTSHWSPAPVPAGGRATATCHACNLPIEGRVIALAGLKERWHPACMQCHVCSTALADFEISPEPAFSRAARIARVEARENGDYVAEGELTDGDRKLRFYCHLDWHEAFAPRCQTCKTPIIGEHITALGGKHYHYGHFFCCECGDPFGKGVPHVELEGYAWCTGCMEKRTERRAPRCGLCKRNVVGEVVKALGKEFHAECFRCGDCQRGFVDGEIYLRDDVGVSCRECMERWAKNGGR